MRITRKIYLIALFSAVYLCGFAQDDNKKMAEDFLALANSTYFETRALNQANELYVQAAGFDPENIEANYMAGRTCLQTNLKSNASMYLLRVLESGQESQFFKFNLLYMIGQSFQYGMEFEKAIDYYNQYLEKVNQNPRKSGEDVTPKEDVERRIYECQNGIEFVNAPGDYVIENAGSSINSEYDDFAPVVTADETFMAFTTRRQDENTNADVFDDMLYYEDVFYTERTGDKWNYARNIGPPVNIRYHSSNLAISSDGKQLYLFKSQNGGDIFLSEKNNDGTWAEPVALNGNINSTFFENSVSISPDGNTLYFSSDRPISADKQDLDIYYSQKDRKGEWGPAKNIGAVVNTPYDDDGPFIDADGKTLYFSSKGHKGMGGFDIYRTIYNKETDEWSEPENLGYPMNSPDNDIYFVTTGDGKRGYYASAKADGFGFTDIYHVRLPDDASNPQAKKVEQTDLDKPDLTKVEKQKVVEPEVPEPVIEPPKPVILVLKTVDKLTKKALEVEITINKADNSPPVPVARIGNGMYQAQFMNEATSTYNITIQKSGYMYKNVAISVPAMTTTNSKIAKQIMLDKIQVGYSQVIRNIYFDFGTARLQSASDPELNKLLRVIEENPQYVIEISGHTDNVGSNDFNQWLSERRAQAVINYMTINGQSDDGRFIAEGYGENRPLASNDDEEWGREFNRRVEFKVLKVKP